MPHRSTLTLCPDSSNTDDVTVAYRLRDYQHQVVEQVWRLWVSGTAQKILLQLPTGAGKTVVFATIAHRFVERNAPVLVLAHREELLLQAKAKLESVTGERVGLIKAGYREDRTAPIQVASVASLLNRQLPPASLVIVDEAHHSTALTYTQLFDQFPEAAILGVTATPVRTDGRGFREIYDRLVIGPAVSELIEQAYLSPYRLFAAPKTVDTTGVGRVGGDYNSRQLAKAINTSLVMGDLIDAWTRYAHQKKTVVFAVNVEHSMAIAAAYRDRGIAAEHLDGSVKDSERRATLERFRSGKTLVLTNCGLFAEGFDVPSIEAVQCVRPTQSLALWLQIVGRSLRPSPGKTDAIVIDHTENWIVHGLPDRPFPWSLDAIELDGDRWGVMCPHCRASFRPEPAAQTPRYFQWCSQQLEFKSIMNYVCPNCEQPLEMEQWHGNGEPPLPRELERDHEAEIWEIPTDCHVEILADLYRLVGFQRQVKRHVTLQWLTERITRSHPDLGFPELRECARLAGMDQQWAIQWAWQTVEHRWPERLPATPLVELLEQSQTQPLPDHAEEETEREAVTEVPVHPETEPPSPLAVLTPPSISPHEIVRAIAARRQLAGLDPHSRTHPPTRTLPALPAQATRSDNSNDEIINLDMTDCDSTAPGCPLPQLPALNANRAHDTTLNPPTHQLLPTVDDRLHTTEHQLRGKLGTWHTRVSLTPTSTGFQTHILYRDPNGRSFEEQIAGYHPQRYRQGIIELEQRVRPAKQSAVNSSAAKAVSSPRPRKTRTILRSIGTEKPGF